MNRIGERLTAPPVDDELGRLAASFNGLLDRLASALNHQRQFMAGASHELRTPVSVVRSGQAWPRKSIGRRIPRVARHHQRAGRPSLAPGLDVPAREQGAWSAAASRVLNLDDILAESARRFRVLAQQRGVTSDGERGQEVASPETMRFCAR